MIRTVLALFVGAVALCGYIISQQPERTAATPLPFAVNESNVARAASAPLLPEALTATTEVNAIAPPVIVTPEPELIAAPDPLPEPTPKIMTDDTNLVVTTANILAGLGLEIDIETMVDPQDLGAAVRLANIGVIEDSNANRPAPRSELEFMVVSALQNGLSDAEIDAQINAAAIAGDITVPKILVTSQGEVDTKALLETIVTTAQSAATGLAPEVPDVPAGESTGVEVRVVQRATETEQYRFYTVARGDSLGGISAKFYGDVYKYQIIYEANRNLLSSPDQIKVGQRLAIPNLPEV